MGVYVNVRAWADSALNFSGKYPAAAEDIASLQCQIFVELRLCTPQQQRATVNEQLHAGGMAVPHGEGEGVQRALRGACKHSL